MEQPPRQARDCPQIELVIHKTNENSNNDTTVYNCHPNLSIDALKCIITRFHAGYFRISLSLGSQALLWKTIFDPNHDVRTLPHVLHVLHPAGYHLLWLLSFCTHILLSIVYIFRCAFYYEMVKAEFLHHVGVNYLFVPWISWLLLLQSSPFINTDTTPYTALWWFFVIPVVVLDVKIYGQWFTKGKRLLSRRANPTSQLSVIGNLVGAQAAALMGWRESAMCMFSLGMVHYLVLFVTLYQHLSERGRFPPMLRPVFFLFFAAPSMASLAWKSIAGGFDMASKMLFFLSLFLFTSLLCRPLLFKRSMTKFSIAWWAYSFPLSTLALASTEYALKVKGPLAQAIMLLLSSLSVAVSLFLILLTMLKSKLLLVDNTQHSVVVNSLQ